MSRRAIFFNLEPRYTAGSPAATTDEDLAWRVVEQEREAYEHAKEGRSGAADKVTADKLGLELIVFEMVERAHKWYVWDLITEKQHEWPMRHRCPNCKRIEVCQRGVLKAHQTGNPEHNPCARDTYVGKELKDVPPRTRAR